MTSRSQSPFLSGDQIDLIPADKKFIIPYKKWVNDPEVRKYFQNAIPITMEELKQQAEEVQEGLATDIGLIIIHKKAKSPIGIAGFSSINWINRNANVFISIGEKDYWGKGLATEVIKILLSYGFEELNFHKIYAQIFTPNIASWKCVEKCGFKHEGTLKDEAFLEGHYISSKNYGLLKKEWQKLYHK